MLRTSGGQVLRELQDLCEKNNSERLGFSKFFKSLYYFIEIKLTFLTEGS